MRSYFEVDEYISASKLKGFIDLGYKNAINANVQKSFDFGTLTHTCIFEPNTIGAVEKQQDNYELACRMRDTFMKDALCKELMQMPGKSEFEFYRMMHGIYSKCKTDRWVIDPKIIIEFKTLTVGSQNAFEKAIDMFGYDLAAAWYIDITGAESELIVAVSKKNPTKLFKYLVTRSDKIYKSGKDRYIRAIKMGLKLGEIREKHIYNHDKLQSWLISNTPKQNSAHII